MALASTYDINDPEIRRLTEVYREAHWKLAAPKGFAALQVGRGLLLQLPQEHGCQLRVHKHVALSRVEAQQRPQPH